VKAAQLNLEKEGYLLTYHTVKHRGHYKHIMSLGRCFPTTKAQAKYFISKKFHLDFLNADDVEKIEAFLNKHGFEGDYVYTKSKLHVWLNNHNSLYKALKFEYNI
jgi:hypothetical protein